MIANKHQEPHGSETVHQPEQLADRAMARMLIVKSIVEDGFTQADFAGVSPQQIEAGYARAYQLIDAGQPEQAEKLLEYLCQLDHYQARLFFALGVARQMQRKYIRALDAYAASGLHDPENPHLSLRAAECFMATSRYAEAILASEGCIELCAQQASLSSTRKRAETILTSAQRKSGKQPS